MSDPSLDPLPPGYVRWETGATPPPRFWTDFGGGAPEDPEEPTVDLWRTVGGERPWGTALLVLAWGWLFAAIAVRHEAGSGAAYARWGANLWGAGTSMGTAGWRLLAYTFLHATPAHLFFNALAMVILGPAVERVFTRAHFWLIFAGGGIAAALASRIWHAASHPGVPGLSIGASGAIFALGGALLAAAWRLRRRLPPSRARALAGGILPMLFQGLVAGFQRAGTDNAAHAAGLVLGFVLGLVLGLDPRLTERPVGRFTRALGALAALALAAALAAALYGGLRASGASG